MNSRIRSKPDRFFECFLEVADQNPWWLQKFPENYNNEETLQSVIKFTFPCDVPCTTVQHFSFVLTDIDSKWTFGFCRHAPNSQTALCILSYLPWHEIFYKILNTVAEITLRSQASDPSLFLKELYNTKIPLPSSEICLHVDGKLELKLTCPDDSPLPRIPDNRNLTEYYSAVDSHNMMIIFASMLNERRILITSNKLSRLSACVQAANLLIFPMHWQHIFIPVLPKHLVDYLNAPMPFLIGVPSPIFARVRRAELGEVVILHADRNRVETPFDDLQSMPPAIVASLRHRLKNPGTLLNDGIAKAFLHTLVHLIGGYRDALRIREGQRITFDQQAFIITRSSHMQPFLERMLHLQIFHQFIEERLEMLNAGQGLNDFFENEVMIVEKNHKKESGVFFKNVKSKANPAMKYAYKHMRDKSKKAYKEVKSMFQDLQQRDTEVPHAALGPFPGQPRSAPPSPTSAATRSYSVRERNTSVISYVRRKDGVRRSTLGHAIEYKKPYDLLQVDEVGCEAHEQSDYEEESEEELRMRRLSLDLMDDLQDIIYNKRASSQDSLDQDDHQDKPPPLPRKSGVVSRTAVNLAHPIPPPRSRRRDNQTVACEFSTNAHYPSEARQVEPASIKPSYEVPLICLDSDELVFDPLLDKGTSSNAPEALAPHEDIVFTAGTSYQSVYHQPLRLNSVVPAPPPSTAMANPEYFGRSSFLHNGDPRPSFGFPVYSNINNNQPVQRQVTPSPTNLLRAPVTRDSRLYQSLPNSPVKMSVNSQREATTGNVRQFCELFEAKQTDKGPFEPFGNVTSTSATVRKGSWQTFD